ncbi:MAG: putative DNA binding domain-containing protein [Erysipelotrichaceae bacterium]|nr:putative DNA binding domain-containing protein [Erysipelotrichaceae bacterium]
MKENRNLEYKEEITNTFLKTVRAFSNYDGGMILFGVNDSGEAVGLDDVTQKCLDIENRINDSISPQPDYTLSVIESGKAIALSVKPGSNTPYMYKSKAYKRNDTATIEVDSHEMRRLILKGENKEYEELPSDNQNLDFNFLGRELKDKTGIETFNTDVLKTLNLYSDSTGYNNAAAILSDQNRFPGIDIARFGETINIFLKRRTFEYQSILQSYYDSLDIYRDYYQYDEIDGTLRKTIETIPEEAFREAVANAIVHRVWDINAQIRISMFDDRIEIVSPGGLPDGISEKEYLEGRISVLRNPILANVFHRLDLIEKFGTGIKRIIQCYADSQSKPSFEISVNSIQVTLPLIKKHLDLTADEMKVYNLLSRNINRSISEILSSASLSFGKSKTTELLKKLEEKGIVAVEGKGRGTKYKIR